MYSIVKERCIISSTNAIEGIGARSSEIRIKIKMVFLISHFWFLITLRVGPIPGSLCRMDVPWSSLP